MKLNSKKQLISEDWLSFWLGIIFFALSLGTFAGIDILGWGVKVGTWQYLSKALNPVSANFKGMPGYISVLLTYLLMLLIVGIGNRALGGSPKKFIYSFTIIFFISFFCWLLGNWANIAATTPAEMKKFGITWSMKLTGEAGFIIALLAGLIIGNFFPKFAVTLKEAVKPELFVKTAIVIMGAGVGIKALENSGLAFSIMFRGFCAIIEAYLIYWAFIYYIARKYFKFSREWAAPLASGISICGVSAAIATGAAIRSRPVVPIMVSSLVVIFAVVELLILPFLAQHFLWNEPLVAGAWMGLAVKTDGAATASGAVTDALILARAGEAGIFYQKDWILNTATNIKVFIDIFIGIWAFVLAYIWAKFIEKRDGDKVKAIEIWQRFPKFVIGYILTFVLFLIIGLANPHLIKTEKIQPLTKDIKSEDPVTKQVIFTKIPVMKEVKIKDAVTGEIKSEKVPATEKKIIPGPAKASTEQANVFRTLFFVLTFFTIGVISNFKKLWEEGIGKLAAVYIIGLFGFIIWIGLFISWLFFHGVLPPVETMIK